MWWYNLRGSNPDNKDKFPITNLSVKPKFNISYKAEYVADGTLARINLDSTDSGAGVMGPIGLAIAGDVAGLTAPASAIDSRVGSLGIMLRLSREKHAGIHAERWITWPQYPPPSQLTCQY